MPLLLLIDHDLEPWPRSGLDTRAWWPRGWDVGPSPGGLVEASRAGAATSPPPWGAGHLQPGLGRAGVSQLFWGMRNSWFHQASCAGVRVPGPREPGRWPEAGWAGTVSDNGHNSHPQGPAKRPFSIWPSFPRGGEAPLATGCTEGKLRLQATSPAAGTWPLAALSCLDVAPCGSRVPSPRTPFSSLGDPVSCRAPFASPVGDPHVPQTWAL